jgi:hypothetical protein
MLRKTLFASIAVIGALGVTSSAIAETLAADDADELAVAAPMAKAYCSEVYRAGVNSVHRSQRDAALARQDGLGSAVNLSSAVPLGSAPSADSAGTGISYTYSRRTPLARWSSLIVRSSQSLMGPPTWRHFGGVVMLCQGDTRR